MSQGQAFLVPLGTGSPSPSWKLQFSARHGTRLAWIVDPLARQVVEVRPGRTPATVAAILDASPVIPGASFSLPEVFGWLVLPR